MATASMVICLRPLPIKSVNSVMVQPNSASACAFSPRLRLAGSSSHAMTMVSWMGPATSNPWRRQTVKSYLALWASLGIVASANAGWSAARTASHGTCAPSL